MLPTLFRAVVSANEKVAPFVIANGARLMEVLELLPWNTGVFVASIGGFEYLVAVNMKYLGW